MSKIEEALKKAKVNKEQGADTQKPVALVRGSVENFSNKRDLARSDNSTSIVSHTSSSKEIALMEEGELLNSEQLSQLKIISSDKSDSKIANTYRDLRTKLIKSSAGKNFIAMITSCVDDNSSSSVTLNLASAFSFEETKTSLIIDCNLNNPNLHKTLQKDIDLGLIDYLQDQGINIEDILYKTGIKRLRMIPAGVVSETASEYFTSQRLRELMSDLLARYTDRFIFLNTPPITESADSKILAELCDFVILVVPYGTTSKAKLQEAANKLGKDKLLGVIFNNIPKAPSLGILGI